METMKPLIDKLVEMIQSGTDFVSGQIPDVAQQILAYWNYVNIGIAVFSFVALSVWIWFSIATIKRVARAKYNEGPEPYFVGAVFFAIGIVPTAFLFGSIADLFKIHLAPKLFLIDALKYYLK